MGAHAGLALKFLQWFIRGVQFCCAAIILALFSYFMANMSNRGMYIDNWIKAVAGISGAAVLYTLLGLLLLCCVAGHPVTSFIAIFLDICFIGAFIFIAAKNGHPGTSSCTGHISTSVFGSGNADSDVPDPGQGFDTFPTRLARICQMQSAVLAVSIVGIIFFLLSALMEMALVRHRRKEKRFGPGPANNYTEGYGGKRGRGGLFGFGRKRNTGMSDDPNALPAHTHPDDVRGSYATEETRVGTAHGDGNVADGTTGGYNKYGESGYNAPPAAAAEHPQYGNVNPYRSTAHNGVTGGVGDTAPAQYPPGNYKYDDGVYSARV